MSDVATEAKTNRHFFGAVQCEQKPEEADLCYGVADGSGTIDAQAALWEDGWLFNVNVRVTGEYAEMSAGSIEHEVEQLFS